MSTINIQGYQTLTMLDFPGHTACTVFTGGCNLRCPFCHNVPLVLGDDDPAVKEADFFAFLEKRRGILDGVAVTGGEPLMQRDLGDFLKQIRSRGFLVKLDTNGFFPDRLAALLEEGLLDYVAMDVKNRPEKYPETCGVKSLDLSKAARSIALLKESGVDYEFRTTVVREFHTVADIEAAAKWIAGAKRYYLQAFKDSGILLEGSSSAVDESEMRRMREAALTWVPIVEIRGI